MRDFCALCVAFGVLLTVTAEQELRLSVVESTPALAYGVAAAVEAAGAVARARAASGAGAEAGAGAGVGAGEAGVEPEIDALPVRLETVVVSEPGEPLDVPHQICVAAGLDVHAVLTGMEGVSGVAEAAAARAGVPLLALGGGAGTEGAARELLALFPNQDIMLDAAKTIFQEKGWSRAVLLHDGGARAAAALAPDDTPLQLLARPLPRDDALLRDLLLVLKKEGHENFMVWSSAEQSVRVLAEAQRVGLLAARHSYLVLSLELHTQDLYNFSYGGANITGFMSFDVAAAEERVAAWRAACQQQPACAEDEAQRALSAETLPTGLLLAQQAATIAARALFYLDLPQIDSPGSCTTGAGAFHADTLLNFLRSEEHSEGMEWDADGARHDVVLQVVELTLGGRLQKVGRWRRRDGVTWQRPPVAVPPTPSGSMTNLTFNVLIAMNKPYVMRKESVTRMVGNDQYEGFCIELIEKLAEILQFNYTFVEQLDGNYSAMLEEINSPTTSIDFAITDLTITADREAKVDFTTPFMNLGISILYRKPKPPEPRLFAFLLPFSTGVWIWLVVAYVGTSLVLYVVGRLCPEEWQNPYPCVEEPQALENQFTLANALWFNVGAVLLQGSEIAPVAYGSRSVASAWWLFALVITSSYTANLATLLAKKSSTEIINNVYDLAYNTDGIEYGAKEGGATYTFFKKSASPLFHYMFEQMESRKMPASNPLGINMVTESDYKYAFLMESTSIEYEVERNCAVIQVGELLDSKGYGIAMRKNSEYRQALNLALLRLQEAGELRRMKQVWWEERHGGGACKAQQQADAEELDMKSFNGLFLVLVVGSAVGVALSCCDLARHAHKHPRDPARSFRHNFAQELRFVFRFEQSSKPLEGPLIESRETSVQSSVDSELLEGGEAEERDGDAAEAAVATTGEGAGAGAGEGEEEEARGESALSARRRRRRSSMHNASVRLARHARDTHQH